MVFQPKLLEKSYFIAKMSGLANGSGRAQFWLLESALSFDNEIVSHELDHSLLVIRLLDQGLYYGCV